MNKDDFEDARIVHKTLNHVKSHSDLNDIYKTKYNINFNPLKSIDGNNEENTEKLKLLKTISSLPFLKTKEYDQEVQSIQKNKSVKFKDLDGTEQRRDSHEFTKKNCIFFYKLDEKISIDNEVFNKKDIDLVAKKILTKCNYVPDLKTKFSKGKI